MRKFGVTLFAVLALVLIAGLAAAETRWVTKEIPWSGLAVGSADTLGITAVTDSNRTSVIDTGDWSWLELSGAATAVLSQATVTVVATTFNNGASDSLYMFPEKGYQGKFGMFHTAIDNGAAAFGNCLVRQPGATFGTGGAVFQGPLMVDADAGPSYLNMWLVPQFRLNIFGDTTTKLQGCKVYLTYPQFVP